MSVQAGRAGKIAQVVTTMSSAHATSAVAIPVDDSLPQSGEGSEMMTLAITPTNASSTLVIEVDMLLSPEAARTVSIALFQDSGADAIAASGVAIAIDAFAKLALTHSMTAGTTSATTFKVRMGATDTTSVNMNGFNGNRSYGAIPKSSIVITEVLP